jgi:threonine dehydratase
MLTLSDVRAARETIKDAVRVTPVFSSTQLGRRIDGGVTLWLKAESLQKTGSFKPRGALNRVRNTPHADLERGIITVSAGNHAQGVAWAAREAGVPCVVCMRANASHSKVAATRGYGAEVLLIEGTVPELFAEAERLAVERGLLMVHPYDDELIMAGQGTVGLEIVEQVPDVDVVVCGVGGGGLLSGVALAVKSLKPSARVYGVEPAGAASMRRAWEAGAPVALERVVTIADGLAAPGAGAHCYAIARQYVDDILVVTDDEIVAALKDILMYAKLYVEPGAAAGVAALLTGKVPVQAGETVVAILSGGNLDLEALKELL